MRIQRLVGMLFLFASHALAQEFASLQGAVINTATGEPLSKVQVHAMTRGSMGLATAFGAVTDLAGHFSIAPIAPGTYTLLAMRAGFVLTGWSGTAPVPTIEVKAGQPVADLRLSMAPRAILSGRVMTDTGEPLRGIAVRAESGTPADLLMTGQRIGSGDTDDRGHFAISVLPGKYRVRAETAHFPDEEVEEIRTDGSSTAASPPTWYPNARSAAAGGLVEAVAGRETGSIDIHMARPVSLSISGIVTGIPAGAHASVNFNVLVHRGNTIFDIEAGPDGRFERNVLEPGTYTIYAETKEPPARSAIRRFELSEAPVSEVELALRTRAPLPGRIEAPAGTTMATLSVALMPLIDTLDMPAGVPVQPDGKFELRGIGPGRYNLVIRRLPADLYVARLLLNGDRAEHRIVDLTRGAQGSDLRITLASGAAEISGMIQGKSVASWERAGMVYFVAEGLTPFEDVEGLVISPTPQSDNRQFTPNADGSFRIQNVPPGKYKLWVIDFASGRSPDRAAMERMMASVPTIEVRLGDRLVIDPKPLNTEANGAK